MTSTLLAGIEAGGTKFVCALSHGQSPALLARESFPTLRDPAKTLEPVLRWLTEMGQKHGKIAAIGIGSFGPIELDETSPRYGSITTTPKPGWQNAPLVSAVKRVFDVPIGFDTDVNAAALGEHAWGAGAGANNLVYITIGTGIGGGALINGKPVHGLVHPEMGHLRVKRMTGDTFKGVCYAHGDCWEGLCCGPAIQARAGKSAQDLAANSKAWSLTAAYTAQALHNIVVALSPQKIILGGSVPKGGKMGVAKFMMLVRKNLQLSLNKYIQSPAITKNISQFVLAPGLGDDAGVCGAIVLAKQAMAGRKQS